MDQVTFVLPRAMIEEVDAIANSSDLSRGWVFRAAVRQYLEQRKPASASKSDAVNDTIGETIKL